MNDKIDRSINMFPLVFELKENTTGDVFRISKSLSYINEKDEVILLIRKLDPDQANWSEYISLEVKELKLKIS